MICRQNAVLSVQSKIIKYDLCNKLRNNGDGAEMLRRERKRSRLNICAPKPRRRRVPRSAPSPFVPMRSCFGRISRQLDRACLNTTSLIRGRNYAPLSLVAIRASSSPCAALRRSARLSRGCSSSRRENAETFASLLVPTELSQSSLIFTPRE